MGHYFQSPSSSNTRRPIPCPFERLLWSWWYCPSVSQTSVSQTSVSQTSVSQTSVSQTSVSQTSLSQTSIRLTKIVLHHADSLKVFHVSPKCQFLFGFIIFKNKQFVYILKTFGSVLIACDHAQNRSLTCGKDHATNLYYISKKWQFIINGIHAIIEIDILIWAMRSSLGFMMSASDVFVLFICSGKWSLPDHGNRLCLLGCNGL